MLGYLVLLVCVAGGISLLTWSAADPSLTHATSGPTRNLLGPVGAILSDLIMQMLGIAGVFALLPPIFWALQMLATQRLHRLRYRLLFAPTAVLLLAGAASSLPSAAAWPLHHGYGGMLGDLGLGILSSLLAHLNPDRSAAAAGLFYFAAGLLVLATSLGLTQQDLKLICQPGPGGMRFRHVRRWWKQAGELASARREPLLAAPVRSARPVREPQFHPEPEPPEIIERAPEPEPHYEPAPAAYEPEPVESGRGASFDSFTDHSSRAIAERFAPAGSEAVAARPARMPELPMPALDRAPVSPTVLARPAPPPNDGRQPRRGDTASRRPPLSMLKRAPAAKTATELSETALRGQARLIEDALKDFGVKGEVKEIHPGPVITLFEFEPARGVKSARVIGLADDLARAMGAASVRAAIVPGRNAIGIELPNARRERVNLRELLESDTYRSTDATLPLALGRNISGTPVFADLARMPHLLVAGTTGAGKSVGVNAMILSLLYRLSPDQCRFLMIDPKMLELSVYNGIPHLLCPVVTDAHKAVAALNWAVGEMEERYRRMSRLAVRNIDVYNNRVRQAQKQAGDEADLAPMPYIVIVVDEFADLMIVAGKEIEIAVQRLAQMARAAGIHLIMATQRPSVDIITGTIKANFPTRISFKVASKFDSRTILNEQGAEQLLGQGDMLFSNGAGRTLRVHGPFVSDEEVEGIARYLREQGEPRYVDGITDTAEDVEDHGASANVGGDDLYDRAVAIIVRDQKASTSYLQRRLSIGYNRAADLIERMEREGLVGPVGPGGRRPIL